MKGWRQANPQDRVLPQADQLISITVLARPLGFENGLSSFGIFRRRYGLELSGITVDPHDGQSRCTRIALRRWNNEKQQSI